MILDVSCAIRGCLKFAKVDSREWRQSEEFALCYDCETSILLDLVLFLEQTGEIGEGNAAQFAARYNGFRRKRKGLSMSHKSGIVKSIRDIRTERLIVGGN